jgi:hypothetical protein
MEPEGSLPYSQQPATRPYPVPDEYVQCPPTILKIHLNIILPSMPTSSKWPSSTFSFQSPQKTWEHIITEVK